MAGVKFVDVHKSYVVDKKNVPVLNGINLSVPENKITVILGKSGCGKTTLLRLAGGLEAYESGTIKSHGSGKMAFVFQEPRLMPWLTVEKNVTFGIKKKEIDQDRIHQILTTVGLDGFAKAYPRQLSGGMQQRAAIARALAYDPSMILMDEPFAALDYFTRELMQKELLRVQMTTNCGILFVTHSIDEALFLGHKIVVLSKGLVKSEFDVPGVNEERDLLSDELIEIKRQILISLESN